MGVSSLTSTDYTATLIDTMEPPIRFNGTGREWLKQANKLMFEILDCHPQLKFNVG